MENEIDYVKIGSRIRLEREKFGFSRENLAELLNLSPYFLGQIERGERKMSINTLINVSQCLHISIDYLIFEKDNTAYTSDDLHALLNRCSKKELNLLESVIKLILPHLTR